MKVPPPTIDSIVLPDSTGRPFIHLKLSKQDDSTLVVAFQPEAVFDELPASFVLISPLFSSFDLES